MHANRIGLTGYGVSHISTGRLQMVGLPGIHAGAVHQSAWDGILQVPGSVKYSIMRDSRASCIFIRHTLLLARTYPTISNMPDPRIRATSGSGTHETFAQLFTNLPNFA